MWDWIGNHIDHMVIGVWLAYGIMAALWGFGKLGPIMRGFRQRLALRRVHQALMEASPAMVRVSDMVRSLQQLENMRFTIPDAGLAARLALEIAPGDRFEYNGTMYVVQSTLWENGHFSIEGMPATVRDMSRQSDHVHFGWDQGAGDFSALAVYRNGILLGISHYEPEPEVLRKADPEPEVTTEAQGNDECRSIKGVPFQIRGRSMRTRRSVKRYDTASSVSEQNETTR